jgi:hypothetical protein
MKTQIKAMWAGWKDKSEEGFERFKQWRPAYEMLIDEVDNLDELTLKTFLWGIE